MKLVVANMSNVFDWQRGIVNRNFFIVRELIRSGGFEEVILIDFLALNPLKRWFGWRRSARYAVHALLRTLGGGKRLGLRHGIWRADDFFQSKIAVQVIGGIGYGSTYQTDLRRIQSALQSLGCNADNTLLWSYQAFAPEILDWPARVRVFDAVDDWSLHASYQKEADFLRKNYDRISQKADVIFTVSAGLAERFDPAKTRWIPNGIDPAPFTKDWPMPSDLAALPRPLIGYVGTVQERLDFALLKTVCRNHADKSFVFIGPVWKGVADQVASLSTACPNVHFLGRRPYEQTPAYLQAMDIAIIPHRLDAFLSSTNPMKMYDYLAAGKPIVSTPGAGTEAFAQHIVIAKDAAEFSEAINRALAADSPAQHQARQSALSGHLWSDRLAAMQAFLRDRLRFP